MERKGETPIENRIAAAIESLVKEGRYPRAVKAADLINFGLITNADQASFCDNLINRPDNKYGRVLIISRNPDEVSSPVRWFARGKDNPLGESFIPPHIEPPESKIETFELIKGRAFFVFHMDDSQNTNCRFIELQPHMPVVVQPGQTHSILCCSSTVEVVEYKLVSPRKICPQFARDLNLVDENCAEQSGPQITKYLRHMHELALKSL